MPKRSVDRSQTYSWPRRWQNAEKEAAEDITARRVRTFDSTDGPAKDLDQK